MTTSLQCQKNFQRIMKTDSNIMTLQT